MSIDVNNQILLSFAEAAARLSTGGRRLHVATIHRWAQRGIRGVRLEYAKVGRYCVTTADAVERFVAELTAQDQAHNHVDRVTTTRPQRRAPRARQVAVDRAKKELAQAGIK